MQVISANNVKLISALKAQSALHFSWGRVVYEVTYTNTGPQHVFTTAVNVALRPPQLSPRTLNTILRRRKEGLGCIEFLGLLLL